MNAGDLCFARLRYRIGKVNLLRSFQMSKEGLALAWGQTLYAQREPDVHRLLGWPVWSCLHIVLF
jgi:hypothetical protein